ncbi:MAG: M28 family peptidase [Flavobacteriales bacterium]
MERCAQYIEEHFKKHCDTVYRQTYFIQGKSYCNVIGKKFGNEKVLVIGAHYDVCGDQQGADDNASGVAGLLELSRCVNASPSSPTLEFVAYTLEEPPYFRTEFMGSFLHAKVLAESGVDVIGMISLEMIGYFSDQANSQTYPMKALKLVYGKKGNFITLVRKLGSSRFERKFSRKFKHARRIKTKRFTAPVSMPGIDFSDHLNYWEMGFPALMITDTAFMRNFKYHTKGDVPERLDYTRMSETINATAIAVLEF